MQLLEFKIRLKYFYTYFCFSILIAKVPNFANRVTQIDARSAHKILDAEVIVRYSATYDAARHERGLSSAVEKTALPSTFSVSACFDPDPVDSRTDIGHVTYARSQFDGEAL